MSDFGLSVLVLDKESGEPIEGANVSGGTCSLDREDNPTPSVTRRGGTTVLAGVFLTIDHADYFPYEFQLYRRPSLQGEPVTVHLLKRTEPKPVRPGWEDCAPAPGVGLVLCVMASIYSGSDPMPHTAEAAFEVVKRVVWVLRNQGAQLLTKPRGDNTVAWQGVKFSASRIVYQGRLVKLLSDVPTTNGPQWLEEGPPPPQQDGEPFPAIDPALS